MARRAVEESRQPKIVCRGESTAQRRQGTEWPGILYAVRVARDGAAKGFVTAKAARIIR